MRRLLNPERIDESKLWALLLVLLGIFVLYPLAVGLDVLRFYRLALILVLGLATYSISGNRIVLRIALAIGIPAAIGQIVVTSVPSSRLFVVGAVVLSIAFLTFVILILLASVFRPGEITGGRIAGAICVYLLAGLLWAQLYATILVFDASAFNIPAATREVFTQVGELALVYFSFVTLTTLGYGDITPASPLAQTVTWLEAVSGQLYIAILLARLVSLHVTRVRAAGPADESD